MEIQEETQKTKKVVAQRQDAGSDRTKLPNLMGTNPMETPDKAKRRELYEKGFGFEVQENYAEAAKCYEGAEAYMNASVMYHHLGDDEKANEMREKQRALEETLRRKRG